MMNCNWILGADRIVRNKLINLARKNFADDIEAKIKEIARIKQMTAIQAINEYKALNLGLPPKKSACSRY